MFHQFFYDISTSLSLPIDQLKYIAAILLTYPVALFYAKFISTSSTFGKNLYSIVTTLFLFVCIHDQLIGLYHLLLSCVVTYTLLSTFKGELGAKLVFLWAMIHMSYTHILRQYYDYGLAKMDYSGPQMIWTIKLTMFAFNVYDGQRDLKQLSGYQIERRIQRLPSFIDFLGYVFYFGGFFVGPAFDYFDYQQFLRAEYFNKVNNNSSLFPPTILRAVKCFVVGIICATVPIFVAPYLNVKTLLTPEYLSKPFVVRVGYVTLVPLLERFKYYFVWSLAEGAFILSGFGYNGSNSKGISNVDIAKVEVPDNLKMVLENWNMATNLWLRNYIYLRLTPIGSKPSFFAQLSTFFTSALWHGFYPGYYLTFIFGGFINELARKLRRTIRPVVLSHDSKLIKALYDIVGTLSTCFALNYLTIPFLSLTFTDSYIILKSVYFYIHIIVFVSLFIFRFIPNKVKVAKVPPTSINPISSDAPKPEEISFGKDVKKMN
ncbi:MBOAT-domain-containing protein [Neoconidiobolus thromboides FSU 785]|nr:MBOAT-domain-containing protein [Neoconidiobolus thromboides FSU 785]